MKGHENTKKYPNHRSWGEMVRERKCMPCVDRYWGSKDLNSRILGGSEKGSVIKLQLGTNILANEVKTSIQNYFEKVLYENLTF
jgi:hypothetical protein